MLYSKNRVSNNDHDMSVLCEPDETAKVLFRVCVLLMVGAGVRAIVDAIVPVVTVLVCPVPVGVEGATVVVDGATVVVDGAGV